MPIKAAAPAWLKLAGSLALSLVLVSCGTPPERPAPGAWAGRPLGRPPTPNPALKQTIISRATREWEFFGRQTVVFKGSDESIPHVGDWEDDDYSHSGRVNAYWRAVGKPGLDGMDCKEPWSAAFISWVMQSAGVPEGQFPRAPAHWIYLSSLIDQAPYPGRWFVPRRLADYSPNPGDLICASRAGSRPGGSGGYASAHGVQGMSAHCDLVVAKSGQTIETIGGNVRNSVSRSMLELDSQGHVKTVPRRPWFVVLENRL